MKYIRTNGIENYSYKNKKNVQISGQIFVNVSKPVTLRAFTEGSRQDSIFLPSVFSLTGSIYPVFFCSKNKVT